jgi:hypothetical protein
VGVVVVGVLRVADRSRAHPRPDHFAVDPKLRNRWNANTLQRAPCPGKLPGQGWGIFLSSFIFCVPAATFW